MIDNYKRTINYARISLTDRCNMRCKYCMPQGGVDKKECRQIISMEKIWELCKVLKELGIEKIRFTGGEPLVRKGALEFIERVCESGMFENVSITTNGTYLKQYASRLKKAGVWGINVSLDTVDPELYRELTRGHEVEEALEGIEEAIAVGIEKIKINAVLTDLQTPEQIRALCDYSVKHPIDVRFIELMPIGTCAEWAQKHFVPSSKLLEMLPNLTPVEKEDPSSPATLYQLPGALGHVGIITPITCEFCSTCNRIRMTAEGKIKPCLHTDEEYDIWDVADDPELLRATIESAIIEKPERHQLHEQQFIAKDMKRIGG